MPPLAARGGRGGGIAPTAGWERRAPGQGLRLGARIRVRVRVRVIERVRVGLGCGFGVKARTMIDP